jgi:hypothetical protein
MPCIRHMCRRPKRSYMQTLPGREGVRAICSWRTPAKRKGATDICRIAVQVNALSYAFGKNVGP